MSDEDLGEDVTLFVHRALMQQIRYLAEINFKGTQEMMIVLLEQALDAPPPFSLTSRLDKIDADINELRRRIEDLIVGSPPPPRPS